jgi:hypothetical protein
VGVTTEVTSEMKELSEKVRLRLPERERRMSTDDASRRFYPSRKV